MEKGRWTVDESKRQLRPSIRKRPTDLGTCQTVVPCIEMPEVLSGFPMGQNVKISIHQIYRDSPRRINWWTDLTVFILNGFGRMYWLSTERSITGHNFPFFWVLRITGNKIREFHCPFLEQLHNFSQQVRGRLTQDYRNGDKGGGVRSRIQKPFWTKEGTHSLHVISPHCSAKWANLPPTRTSWSGKAGSGKGCFFQNLEEEEADFKERHCLELLVLLAGKSFLTLRVEEWGWFLGLYGWLDLDLKDLAGVLGLLKEPEEE